MEDTKQHKVTAVTYICFGLTMLHILFSSLKNNDFSHDSWSLYELSLSFLNGRPYYLQSLRGFTLLGDYAATFPPLWPLILSLFGSIASIGIYIFPAVALIAYCAAVLILEKLLKSKFHVWGLGLNAGLLLINFLPFFRELKDGRSIPLQILLFVIYIWVVQKNNFKGLTKSIALGVVAGLLLLNRFDAALISLLLILYGFYQTRSLAILPAFLVTVSPWVIYSLGIFGKIFVTDNSAIALNVLPHAHVTHYYAHPVTLFMDPLLWIGKILTNTIGLLGAFLEIIEIYPIVLIILFFCIKPVRDGYAKLVNPHLKWVIAILLLGTLPQLMAGYFNLRYFAPLLFMCTWAAIDKFAVTALQSNRHRFIQVAAIVLFCVSFLLTNYKIYKRTDSAEMLAAMNPPIQSILNCIDNTGAKYGQIIMFEDYRSAAVIGALTDWHTSITPGNWAELNEADRKQFLKEYQIKYLMRKNDTSAYLQQVPSDFSESTSCQDMLKIKSDL